MKPETWISLVSAAISGAALLYTLWNGRRTSEASLRAVNADARAEEALALAKSLEERDAKRFEDEKAGMDAPQIADRWVSEIQYKWGAHSRMDHYDLKKPVKTPAERHAVEILRSHKENLHLVDISYDPKSESCTIVGWNLMGYKRRFRTVVAPPKLRAG